MKELEWLESSKKDLMEFPIVYIVTLPGIIYVVHCFQKKSKYGIKTPKEEIEMIGQRLRFLKLEMNKR